MKDLSTLSTKELVVEYNLHHEKPITGWKQKTDKLRSLLASLKPELYTFTPEAEPEAPKPSERMTDFEAPSDELSEQSGRPVDHEEHEAKVKKVKKAAQKKAKADGIERGAIRQYCEELLLKSKGVDPETKRPLGLPYSAILEQVERKYPSANTSLNCLRWYATKMNKRTGKDKVVMPIRAKAAA